MSEKRIVTLALMVALAAGVAVAPGQVASAVRAAQEKVRSGDLAAAIALYKQALAARPANRREVRDALDEVTRDYFAQLYDQATAAGSADEKARLLIEANQLDLRDWVGTDFQATVTAAQVLTNEVFEELVAGAASAVAANDPGRAIGLHERARQLNPQAYADANLDRVYRQLKEQVGEVDRLVQQSEQLFRQGRYQEAREILLQAEEQVPGLPSIEEGMRRVDSRLALQRGQELEAESLFWRAENTYERALELDGENREAGRLLARSQKYRQHVSEGRKLYTQGNCRESQGEFRQARSTDSSRFSQDGLAGVVSGDCSQTIPLPRVEIREALLALFDGLVDDSVRIMESLEEEIGDSHLQVPAYLGVAYCYRAFLDPEGQQRFLEDARARFRKVVAAQPGFKLSEKLFSPRVINLLEEVKAESPGGR